MNPIDISVLSDILGTSDLSVIRPILQVWLETSSSRIDAISNALEAKDRDQLRNAVHSAKGTALQIGAEQMAGMCKRVENRISNADWDVIAGFVNEILEEDMRARRFASRILSDA